MAARCTCARVLTGCLLLAATVDTAAVLAARAAMRRGVLFDLDGTLVDSFRLAFDATQIVLAAHGHGPVSEEEYHSATRFCTPERLARHVGLVPGDPKFDAVGAALGAEFDDLYISKVRQAAVLLPSLGGAWLHRLVAEQWSRWRQCECAPVQPTDIWASPAAAQPRLPDCTTTRTVWKSLGRLQRPSSQSRLRNPALVAAAACPCRGTCCR